MKKNNGEGLGGEGLGVREKGDKGTGQREWELTWDVALGWSAAAVVIVLGLARLVREIWKG